MLAYSVGTDRPGKLCYNLSISNDLTQIPDYNSHSPALLYLYLSSDAMVDLQRFSFHWQILITLISQFQMTVCQTRNGIPRFNI